MIHKSQNCVTRSQDPGWLLATNGMGQRSFARCNVSDGEDIDACVDESRHSLQPHHSRMSQRILLSVCTQFGWETVSLDIGTAFLQGKPLEQADKVGSEVRSDRTRDSGSMKVGTMRWSFMRSLGTS